MPDRSSSSSRYISARASDINLDTCHHHRRLASSGPRHHHHATTDATLPARPCPARPPRPPARGPHRPPTRPPPLPAALAPPPIIAPAHHRRPPAPPALDHPSSVPVPEDDDELTEPDLDIPTSYHHHRFILVACQRTALPPTATHRRQRCQPADHQQHATAPPTPSSAPARNALLHSRRHQPPSPPITRPLLSSARTRRRAPTPRTRIHRARQQHQQSPPVTLATPSACTSLPYSAASSRTALAAPHRRRTARTSRRSTHAAQRPRPTHQRRADQRLTPPYRRFT